MKLPDDCTVRLIDLPWSVHGFISESPDGHSNIYINARDSRARQRRALDHELDHYTHDDLNNAQPVREVEARASRRSVRLNAIPRLKKARDLIPTAPAPEPPPVTVPEMTLYQRRVLVDAVTALDHFVFGSAQFFDL